MNSIEKYAMITFFCAGLMGKEDFVHTKYYCPHCGALNQPKNSPKTMSVSSSSNVSPKAALVTRSSSPEVASKSEIVETEEQQVAPTDSICQ